jgi:esterase/lipase superfamily enzyme
MRIYFATNRNPIQDTNNITFGAHISPSGLTDLRFGCADFNETDLDQYHLTVAPEKLEVSPEKANVGDLSEQVLGSNAIFKEVKQEMIEKKQDCVIYIHGFNRTFEAALRDTATMKRLYGARPMTFFLFSWPSDGEFFPKAYHNDRHDAQASGLALGRGLQKLASFLRQIQPKDYCGQSIHIFAHSMGTYALRAALQSIRTISGGIVQRLYDQIVLFAADEDSDSFEMDYKLKSLPDMARRVTIYHNPCDIALIGSDLTKHNPERLGAAGPRNSRALPDKVSVVNVERVIKMSLEDLGKHNYHFLNEDLSRDVIDVLKGTEPGDIQRREYQQETRGYRLNPSA